jgi:hypothetical protein
MKALISCWVLITKRHHLGFGVISGKYSEADAGQLLVDIENLCSMLGGKLLLTLSTISSRRAEIL